MSKVDEMLKTIDTVGMQAKGKAELIKHLYGERLSFRQAIIAKCYDCTGYAADGKEDCEIPECSLYPFMPYGKKPERTKPKKIMSDEQKAKLAAGLSRFRAQK